MNTTDELIEKIVTAIRGEKEADEMYSETQERNITRRKELALEIKIALWKATEEEQVMHLIGKMSKMGATDLGGRSHILAEIKTILSVMMCEAKTEDEYSIIQNLALRAGDKVIEKSAEERKRSLIVKRITTETDKKELGDIVTLFPHDDEIRHTSIRRLAELILAEENR